jgi:hypothetical protein
MLHRRWRNTKWENANKEVYWRLSVDGIPLLGGSHIYAACGNGEMWGQGPARPRGIAIQTMCMGGGGHGSNRRDGDWEEVRGGGDQGEGAGRTEPGPEAGEELAERGAWHAVADCWGRPQGFAQLGVPKRG